MNDSATPSATPSASTSARPSITSSQEYRQVIALINSGKPESIAFANGILYDTVHSEIVWKWALELLFDHEMFIKYFAANILLTKIKRNWIQLNEIQKTEVYQILISILVNGDKLYSVSVDEKIFLNRIALLATLVSYKLPDGIGRIVSFANNMVSQTLPGLGLQILAVVPIEVEDLDISRDARIGINSELQEYSESIFRTCLELLSSSNLGSNVPLQTLYVIKGWTTIGISLVQFHRRNSMLYDVLCRSIATGSLEERWYVATIFRQLLFVDEYPKPKEKDELINQLFAIIFEEKNCQEMIVCLTSTVLNEDIATQFVAEIMSILENQAESIADGLESTNHSRRERMLAIIQFTFAITSHRIKKIAMLSFDFWIAYYEAHISSSSTKQQIYLNLLKVLLVQLRFPRDVFLSTDPTDEAFDDMIEFRDHENGIQENLINIITTLHDGFFSENSLFVNILTINAFDSIDKLVDFETLLFAMYTVMGECIRLLQGSIARHLQLKCDPDEIVNKIFNSHPFISTVRFVFSVVSDWNQKADILSTVPKRLLHTSCLFIGSMSCLYSLEKEQDTLEGLIRNRLCAIVGSSIYFPFLVHLLNCLQIDFCVAVAANALLKLTVHGSNIFISNLAGAVQIVSIFQNILAEKTLELHSIKKVLHGLVGTLILLPAAQSTELLNSIGTIIRLRVENSLQLLRKCDHTALPGLSYCLELSIELLKSSCLNTAMSPRLDEFMTSIWPCFNEMLAISFTDVNLSRESIMVILRHVFNFSGCGFSACPNVMLQEPLLQKISECCTQAFYKLQLASSMRCCQRMAEAIVSASMNLSAPTQEFLADLYIRVVVIGGACFDTNRNVQNDPECMEALFNFLSSYYSSCPIVLYSIFHSNPTVWDNLWFLVFITLQNFRERDVIKAVMLYIQANFCAPSVNSTTDLKRDLIMRALNTGKIEPILLYIFSSLSQLSDPVLLPTFVDTFSNIFIASTDLFYLDHCYTSLRNVILSNSEILTAIPLSEKEHVVNALIHLVRLGSRKLKILLSDLSRICKGELNLEVLFDYIIT